MQLLLCRGRFRERQVFIVACNLFSFITGITFFYEPPHSLVQERALRTGTAATQGSGQRLVAETEARQICSGVQ